MLPQSEGLD